MEITEELCVTRPQDAEIRDFERLRGCTLPDDYRVFLLTHNGGRPSPSGFSFTTRQGREEDSSVNYFFGLRGGRIGSLELTAARYRERIPAGFLPIATDSFGNLILIGAANWNRGKIYFWDHEREDDMPSLKNISLVASTFTEFTNSLSDFDHVA